MVQAKYLEIADDLRGRIARGELVVGAKAPSVRQVAGEWGVAAATAARALEALSRDGVLRAEPRSGFVVTARGESSRGASPGGTSRAASRGGGQAPGPVRDRLVRTAIEIADAEGLAAVSMRSVAARLGVETTAAYRHVQKKDELVMLMADAAYGEHAYPEAPPDGWRPRLELYARTLWALHRAHPWLAQLGPITRPLPLPSLAAHSELALTALAGLGRTPAERFDLHVLLYGYVQGLATNLEREQQAVGTTGLSDDGWVDRQSRALRRMASSGPYPAFAGILGGFMQDGYDLDLDRLFELGLGLLLDGLAARAPAP
ncbi:TetR/AcrR family transcriptional regulator C-terminal domain-containing protein [Isoptericola sp. NPDC057391]|uniref:TetR/AcrR family transcriptional regulator C-terminal domain-containing protein n=1 Tax=Isoptericola sp. NPDC057391 TaxID=3346117 RepID=UPI00363D9BF4